MSESPSSALPNRSIFAAIIKAQSEMPTAKKESVNPAFKSKYADWASVVEAVRKPLADNGLGFVQMLSSTGETVVVVTKLIHVSGEFIESTLALPVAQKTPQAFGSGASYGRRYALMAMLGMSSDDDDGHEASKPAARKDAKPSTPTAPSNPATPTAAQITKLIESFSGIGVTVPALESRIGYPLGNLDYPDFEGLRKYYAEKKAMANADPDAEARRLEQLAAEKGIAEEQAKIRATIDARMVELNAPKPGETNGQDKPYLPLSKELQRNAAFKALTDRIQAAPTPETATLIASEAAGNPLFGPGEKKAAARSAENRALVLKDAANEAKRPPQDTADIPF